MQCKTLFESGPIGYLIALLAGAILALGFAPHSLFFLPFISLSLLLGCWLYVGRYAGFWRGFCFGLGLFGVGVSWVYISIHDYGHTSPLIAGGITLGFVMILSIIPGITGYVFTRYFTINNGTKLIAAFPGLWLFFEWVKSWLFTGFPWLDVGYTQLNSPLRDYAPYVGSYGISMLVAMASGLIVYGIIFSGRKRLGAALGFIAIWAFAPLFGLVNFTSPIGDSVKVTLIQADIPPLLKWDPEQVDSTLEYYKTTTEQHWNSQIIVWPESAVPILKRSAEPYLHTLAKEASETRTSLIIGMPTQDYKGELHNSFIVIGDGRGSYNKRHLVPFGEFTPQPSLFAPAMEYLGVPMANFTHGTYTQHPPIASGVRLMPLICYESAFADLVRTFFDRAQLIVTLSDDLWFGHSWAIDQHLEMTQMRALETGRYALFANNNGSSSIINNVGGIDVRAPNNAKAVVVGQVQPMNGYTPWILMGLNLPLLIMLLFFFLAGRQEYIARKWR